MSDTLLFQGTAPALVTPFTNDDEIDDKAFRNLIEWHIKEGVDGLVVLGTTGENPTISPRERRTLHELSVDQADGRVPVIIGTGTNSTRESIEFSKTAEQDGADALLIVGPYYNKPSSAGFQAHVKEIAGATDLPLIIYNVPSRTGSNITAETTLTLAEEVPSVVGVKEASGDLSQVADLIKGRPDGFGVYSGDDEITFPLMAMGGDGVVSVVSNALPGLFTEMVDHALEGNWVEARRLHLELLPVMRGCFIETNPVPIKTVLAAMNRISAHLRLPLVDPSPESRREILQAFAPYLSETAAG